jgi:LmbE family N-acetylglucosaminyl deacetylase
MATFDGTSIGTDESDWSTCEWLRDAVDFGVPAHSRLVILAAHPDDETLGAGGLIAKATESGIEVHVIVASDGSASHPGSRTFAQPVLASRRRDEAAAAVATLAPDATVEFLELADGRLGEHAADLDEALREACFDSVLLAAPWAFDRHPDHAACAHAARRLIRHEAGAELAEFPIWAWHWGRPTARFVTLDDHTTAFCRLALTDEQRALKDRAIDCYVSQIKPLSGNPGDEALLDQATLRYFQRDAEYFFRIEPTR